MRDKRIRMQQRLITKERHAPKVLSTLQIIMSLARTQSRTKVLLSNNPLDYRKSVYKKKKSRWTSRWTSCTLPLIALITSAYDQRETARAPPRAKRAPKRALFTASVSDKRRSPRTDQSTFAIVYDDRRADPTPFINWPTRRQIRIGKRAAAALWHWVLTYIHFSLSFFLPISPFSLPAG